jgi:hypothetical protein
MYGGRGGRNVQDPQATAEIRQAGEALLFDVAAAGKESCLQARYCPSHIWRAVANPLLAATGSTPHLLLSRPVGVRHVPAAKSIAGWTPAATTVLHEASGSGLPRSVTITPWCGQSSFSMSASLISPSVLLQASWLP